MTVSTSTLATFLDMHYDVLVLIVSHMSRIDLLSVMGACRTLHSMLVPHLLAISHNLRRTNQLVSFCHFMLDDKPLRFLYLRDLTISLTFVSSPLLSDLLAKVLRQACKLQGLGLHCGILEGDSRISEAIAAHTGLRKLSLRYPGSGARQMLICMQSPIEVVEVIMSEASEGGIVDPGSLLTGFCSTLTSLSATLARFSTTGIQYPHLTTLELNCCNNLDIGPLIHLFPNVRNLKIVTCQGLCSHHEHNSQAVIVDESDVKLHRLSNLVVQSELLLQWRTLEYVQGDLPNLYCLAIRGSIRRLDIISADAGNADKLPAILTDLHPSSLFLDVNSDFYQDLPELLQEATKGVCALLLIINKRSTFEEMKRLMVSSPSCCRS